MKNHNESLNYQIKSLFFRLSKLSLILSLFLIMIFQTGCATKDEEAPVITNVQVKDNVVTIEANDNFEVTGYISVSNPRQPSLTDENWQESNTFTLDEDGTYYIWVKDESDNLTQYTETIEMSYNLALKFDHLNWLTPAEGTRVVDGVTYNLAELKAEYGDLYRLVEPLTNEEIESRFAYLAEFMEMQKQKSDKCNCYDWTPYGGLSFTNEIDDKFYSMMHPINNYIAESNDTKIEMFNIMYFYITQLERYEIMYPSSFTSQTGALGVGTDILDKVSFADKNLFVRDYTMRYELQIEARNELGLEPEYVIKNWD